MSLNEIKQHEIWSIENMERHAGSRMTPRAVAVEFKRKGSRKYAFAYYRTEDGRYWYKTVTEEEGIRIESGLADREIDEGAGDPVDTGTGAEVHSAVYARSA